MKTTRFYYQLAQVYERLCDPTNGQSVEHNSYFRCPSALREHCLEAIRWEFVPRSNPSPFALSMDIEGDFDRQ